MAKKSKKTVDVTGGAGLTDNPFAALAGGANGTSSSEGENQAAGRNSETSAHSNEASSATGMLSGIVVVRYQRKGRAGKEVTLVEKLELESAATDTLCRELKRTLGCGGHVENGVVVLAGDQRERLPDLLRQRGARKVRGA